MFNLPSSMEFFEEWKPQWPIGSVFSPPLLLAKDEAEPPLRLSKRCRLVQEDEEGHGRGKTYKELGPLYFIPSYKSLVELYSSPDLSPRLPLPHPRLTLPRFLHTSGSGLLPTAASRIASEFGHQRAKLDLFEENSSSVADFNRLQLLPCCDGSNTMLAFFPTGNNCDQVGYVIVRFQDSQVRAKINEVNNKVFLAKEKLNHRILKLSVNPIVNGHDNFSGSTPPYFAVIGYLMVCSMQSVYWYLVKTIREPENFQVQSALLDFVGSKSFRSSTVVHSSWNPHCIEESIVLLDTGELYLFDLSSCSRKPLHSTIRVGRKKLQVLWDVQKDHDDSGHACWLSCEFSWHPRILVVAHTRAVFLVDARSKSCNVSCLLKIRMLSTIENDGFIALRRADSAGFNFCVASKLLLLLCDVRQPWRPLLQWVHNLDNPRYLTVFGLSKLRPSMQGENYKSASESGSCILLGSFWSSEFVLFIYGPDTIRRSFSDFYHLFCAWGLPTELLLSGRGCDCGSCLLRDEYSRRTLPKWVDWRQKKDLVLGFSILPVDCVAQLPKEDNSDGFFLLRLMSSGKLELQYYSAAWDLPRISSEAHFRSPSYSDINLFYDTHTYDYDLIKKFRYLKLEYLKGYLKGNLAEILVKKLQQFHIAFPEKEDQDECAKNLETDGSSGLIFSRPFNVFEGINFPISIHETVLRIMWSRLQLALFSPFGFPRVDEFLRLSQDMVKFPFQTPSFCNNRVSYRIQPSNDLLGPYLPPHFLLTLFELCDKKHRTNVDVLSADGEIKLQCDRILEVAEKLPDDHGVSLYDPKDESSDGAEILQSFSLYKPGVLLEEVSAEYMTPVNSGADNKRFANFIFRKQQDQDCNVDTEMTGLKVLDIGCPLELKFKNNSILLGQEELKQFKLLKKHDISFQKGFKLYQYYITMPNLGNQGM